MRRHRESKRRKRYLKRARRFNRHHMRNKCRGGDASQQNLLTMDTERHDAWHLLFRNSDFLYVANLLIRCHAMKTGKKCKVVIVPVVEDIEFDGAGLS